MAGVASITWLRKRGIGVVNSIGSLSVWSWVIMFTLHWGKGELEQLDGDPGCFWIIISDNWSISTKVIIRMFYLAGNRKWHVVQNNFLIQKQSFILFKLGRPSMQVKRTRSFFYFFYFFYFFFFSFIKRGETVRPFKNVEWNSATTCNISLRLVSLKITYLA